jgi:hypothetical protein
MAYSDTDFHRAVYAPSQAHLGFILFNPTYQAETGKEMITRRFATVEPVFGNLRGNKRLHRFTLRGKAKMDGQWKLYCMMHNIEKLANHGYTRYRS